MKNSLRMAALWTWAIAQNTLTFVAVVPLIILGVFVVPVALLSPDDSQKQATLVTKEGESWWLRTIRPWATWWDNPYDGFLGDSALRWALRDIPFGWRNVDYLAQVWWGAFRNPLHRLKSFVITCDIRRCTFTHLVGRDFVRDRADSTGFQFLMATRDDGVRFFRIYWVWQWPINVFGREVAAIIEICHEFRRDHWFQDYTGRDYKNLKGFAFLLHPCKVI